METALVGTKPNASNKRKQGLNHSSQKRKKLTLKTGLKGFFCRCSCRQTHFKRRTLKVLNEYADELFGSDQSQDDAPTTAEAAGSLQKDIESVTATNEKLEGRFQVIECFTYATKYVFIRTTVEDPVKLAETIVRDIFENKIKQMGFLFQLVPIEVTCDANLAEIQRACEPLLEKHFKDSPKSFSVVYNHTNSDAISEDELTKAITDMVVAKGPDHKATFENADVSVVIEVFEEIALLGVVPNFNKYKKYTVQGEDDENMTRNNVKYGSATDNLESPLGLPPFANRIPVHISRYVTRTN